VKQDVLVAVSIIDLQQKSVPVSFRTIMYILQLLKIQVFQFKIGYLHLTMHMCQLTMLRWFQNRDENVLWVIKVTDVKNGPADDGSLTRVNVQDLVVDHSGWLWKG